MAAACQGFDSELKAVKRVDIVQRDGQSMATSLTPHSIGLICING